MKKTLMGLALGAVVGTFAIAPSIAGQPKGEVHKQQVQRAKKELENALVALQDSGEWRSGNKQAATHGVESAITEVEKEMAHEH